MKFFSCYNKPPLIVFMYSTSVHLHFAIIHYFPFFICKIFFF
ncbi:hypothetical protein HMPREF0083_03449 [Aneurinibacillus aneurinilyticus ATCC 12856]|uniref:Uncharacterized protein n=1 Tax=Aneurinibacillus aneurinilyticus ATCC 12856 TaxID=649747 RepID=U1X1Q9_ANEAE|nr:hypothetical protein HMPREF0083_03449 [Aneurinibacillus aneurinilyticus ATCC 12856]